MKICVFATAFPPNVGGIETVLNLLCREFVALGHQVRVLTTASGDGAYPFEVTRQPTFGTIFKTIKWCDVFLQANVSLRWARMLGIAGSKAIYQHHAPYELDNGAIPMEERLKRLLARSLAGVAVSSFIGKTIGVKSIIYNPYDADIYFRSTCQLRTGDLAFVGRLVSQKGCKVLIEALVLLKEAGKFRRLSIIGDGPERPELERMVLAAGLEDHVRFLGTVRGRDLSELLNQHKAIVVPSTCREAFGLVALEGLACGCRPIVSAQGGLIEASGPFGISFPNADARALALAIDSTIDEQASIMTREKVEAHLAQFAPRTIALKYLARFQSLLA